MAPRTLKTIYDIVLILNLILLSVALWLQH